MNKVSLFLYTIIILSTSSSIALSVRLPAESKNFKMSDEKHLEYELALRGRANTAGGQRAAQKIAYIESHLRRQMNRFIQLNPNSSEERREEYRNMRLKILAKNVQNLDGVTIKNTRLYQTVSVVSDVGLAFPGSAPYAAAGKLALWGVDLALGKEAVPLKPLSQPEAMSIIARDIRFYEAQGDLRGDVYNDIVMQETSLDIKGVHSDDLHVKDNKNKKKLIAIKGGVDSNGERIGKLNGEFEALVLEFSNFSKQMSEDAEFNVKMAEYDKKAFGLSAKAQTLGLLADILGSPDLANGFGYLQTTIEKHYDLVKGVEAYKRNNTMGISPEMSALSYFNLYLTGISLLMNYGKKSSTQIMMEMIQELGEQIQKIHIDMNAQFDQLRRHLVKLYKRVERLENNLTAQINEVNASIDNLNLFINKHDQDVKNQFDSLREQIEFIENSDCHRDIKTLEKCLWSRLRIGYDNNRMSFETRAEDFNTSNYHNISRLVYVNSGVPESLAFNTLEKNPELYVDSLGVIRRLINQNWRMANKISKDFYIEVMDSEEYFQSAVARVAYRKDADHYYLYSPTFEGLIDSYRTSLLASKGEGDSFLSRAYDKFLLQAEEGFRPGFGINQALPQYYNNSAAEDILDNVDSTVRACSDYKVNVNEKWMPKNWRRYLIGHISKGEINKNNFKLSPKMIHSLPKSIVWAAKLNSSKKGVHILSACVSRIAISDTYIRRYNDSDYLSGDYRVDIRVYLNESVPTSTAYFNDEIKRHVADMTYVGKLQTVVEKDAWKNMLNMLWYGATPKAKSVYTQSHFNNTIYVELGLEQAKSHSIIKKQLAYRHHLKWWEFSHSVSGISSGNIEPKIYNPNNGKRRKEIEDELTKYVTEGLLYAREKELFSSERSIYDYLVRTRKTLFGLIEMGMAESESDKIKLKEAILLGEGLLTPEEILRQMAEIDHEYDEPEAFKKKSRRERVAKRKNQTLSALKVVIDGRVKNAKAAVAKAAKIKRKKPFNSEIRNAVQSILYLREEANSYTGQ